MSTEQQQQPFARINSTGNPQNIIASIPKPQTQRLKIISMGDEQTGKSCLIKRYCEERFINKYIGTIGIDYGVKKVNVAGFGDVRVNFWDLSGSAAFFDIRNEFYKDAQGCILCFDVTNPKSFASLDGWLQEAQKHNCPKDLVIIVCANKCDAPGRKVSEADGRKWANSRGFPYYETSASSGQNVSGAMEHLFKETMNNTNLRR